MISACLLNKKKQAVGQNKKNCDWIYENRSKSHIGSYETIDFKAQ